MKNKRVLSKIDLGKFTKPDPYKKDIIYDPRGQWDHPGENTRIPGGDITMQGVDYPVWAQPSVGPGTMMQPGQDYNFPGAEYVDEYPQMKKGGSKKKYSKYTRNILATNRLLVIGDLFKKPNKNQIFDPNASFYEDGGQTNDYIETELTDDEIQAYRDGGYIVEESNEYKKGGALLTKKVTCKKCGWTWNAADGGDDMTTCHKCGGQGLIHAQKGGDISIPSLNQMQDGNEVTPVTAPQRDQYIQNQSQQLGIAPIEPPIQQIAPVVPVVQEQPKVPTESTNVYNPYKESLKSFDFKDFAKKKGMGSTVYKYGSKAGIKYKKDANGKWYINSGQASGNKYIAIKDPSGNRAKTLDKSAKPFYAKEGGIVASLTQDEINQYIKNGYIVEQLD